MRSSCRGEKANSDLPNVEINEFGVFVCYVAPEVPTHEAVPPFDRVTIGVIGVMDDDGRRWYGYLSTCLKIQYTTGSCR